MLSLYLVVIALMLLHPGHVQSFESTDYVAFAKSSLRMNADTHLIEELSLANTAKLSPAFSVSLKTFNMIFSFSPVDGALLLSGMKTPSSLLIPANSHLYSN